MATLASAGKTASLTALRDSIDSGSGNGYMEIGTTGFATILATLPLAKPCGSVSADTLTLNTPFSDSAADAGGSAAVARIKKSDGTAVIASMTVGKTGDSAEVILTAASTTITLGQPINVTAATFAYP